MDVELPKLKFLLVAFNHNLYRSQMTFTPLYV